MSQDLESKIKAAMDLEAKIKVATDRVIFRDSKGKTVVSEENVNELLRLLKTQMAQLDELKKGDVVNDAV
jgi:hypothetical protein